LKDYRNYIHLLRYEERVKQGDFLRKKGDPIDEEAVRIFLSLMVKNWDDKWYFSSIGEFDFDAIEIELQPWFSPEFLILTQIFSQYSECGLVD